MTPLTHYDGTLNTYAFVGDSHAGTFDGLLLSSTSSPAELIRTKALWLPSLRAQAFYRKDGFDDALTRMLWALHVLRPTADPGSSTFARPPHAVFGDTMNDVAFEVRDSRNVLVVCMGITDALDLANEFYSAGKPDALDAIVEVRISPIFAGLCALRDAGCKRLYLNALPPAAGVSQSSYSLAMLQDIIETMNGAFERFCSGEGIGFIDSWSRLTRRGCARADLFKDEIHLNRDGALVVLNRLHELLTVPEQALDPEPIRFE